MFAGVMYIFGSELIRYRGKKKVSDNISWVLNFVKGKDKVLRLIAVNQGFNKASNSNETGVICAYTDKKLEEEGYEGLRQLTFKDVRKNWKPKKPESYAPEPSENESCEWIKDICRVMCKQETKYRDKICQNGCHYGEDMIFNSIQWMFYTSMVFAFVPIWLLSKIVQISFPWIIIGYLIFSGLLVSGEIHSFQIVMLGIYIGLQLLVIILGIKVGRIHYILYHLNPSGSVNLNIGSELLILKTNEYYDEVCWYPPIEKLLMNKFGQDIGAIIIDYCRNIKLGLIESV